MNFTCEHGFRESTKGKRGELYSGFNVRGTKHSATIFTREELEYVYIDRISIIFHLHTLSHLWPFFPNI